MSLKSDLIETSVNFVLLVELPGSCIENIDVSIQDLSYICVDALKKKRDFYEIYDDVQILQQQIEYLRCNQKFKIPIVINDFYTEYTEGILIITILKDFANIFKRRNANGFKNSLETINENKELNFYENEQQDLSVNYDSDYEENRGLFKQIFKNSFYNFECNNNSESNSESDSDNDSEYGPSNSPDLSCMYYKIDLERVKEKLFRI